MQVRHAQFQVTPTVEPADLYEDAEIHFALSDDEPPEPIRATGPATVWANVEAHVQITRVSNGDVLDIGTSQIDVPAGDYRVTLRDPRGGYLTRRETVRLDPGSSADIAESILGDSSFFPTRSPFGTPTLRDAMHLENVDATFDDDPAVWLAIIGASRIVVDRSEAEALSDLSLWHASEAASGSAPLYVLAEFDITQGDDISFTLWPEGALVAAHTVPGVDGMYEAVVDGRPGPRYVTIRTAGRPPTTLVTHGLANRCTLLTVVHDAQSRLRVGQFMLPIAHLRERLKEADRLQPYRSRLLPSGKYVDVGPIDSVRFIAQAQRAYAAHDVAIPDGEDSLYWSDLLYDKWLDPVMGIVAAYELVRRNRVDSLPGVVENLVRFFPSLPDTDVLARFANPEAKRPSSPPMMLEGMLTLGRRVYDALPITALDYRGMWTSWNGAEPARGQT